MCHSTFASAISFLAGMSGSAALYTYDLTAEAIFFAWVTLMQLFEFVIHVNDSCNWVNVTMTKFAIIVNHTEIIALWIGILIARKRILPHFVNVAMAIFSLTSVLYTSLVITEECTIVTEESYPYLYWTWNEKQFAPVFYIFFLGCMAMLSAYGLEFALFHTILTFLSYAISFAIYQTSHSVGSMWCFAAAFTPWITLVFVDVNRRGDRDALRRLTTSTPSSLWRAMSRGFSLKPDQSKK
jgi:hypothetical protein